MIVYSKYTKGREEQMAHFYEIHFYGDGHPLDWTYYMESEIALSPFDVQRKLKESFLGSGGPEMHHLDNIKTVNEISEDDYVSFSGLVPSSKKEKTFVLTATLEVTAKNETEAKRYFLEDLLESNEQNAADIKIVKESASHI